MPILDDPRRRRALYRACHRGTKEMDFMLGRYAEAELAGMSDADVEQFEVLLSLPDPEMQIWLMTGEGFAGLELAPVFNRIRAFHGLENKVLQP